MCNTFATHTQENRITKYIYSIYCPLIYIHILCKYILYSTLFYTIYIVLPTWSVNVSIPNPKQPEGTPPSSHTSPSRNRVGHLSYEYIRGNHTVGLDVSEHRLPKHQTAEIVPGWNSTRTGFKGVNQKKDGKKQQLVGGFNPFETY